MSVYSYPDSTIIDEVTFTKSEGGHTRAYLHAAPGVDYKTTSAIICTLADRKWQVEPYSIDNKPLLEVHGFNLDKELIGILEQKGWAQGRNIQTVEKEKKLSLWGRVKKRLLGTAGVFYLAGDAAFGAYGYNGGSAWNTSGGVLYGMGTSSLLLGGRKDPSDLQVRDIAKKMVDHVQEINIELPEDSPLKALSEDRKKGFFHTIDSYLRHYPSEFMNFFFALAGVCIGVAAYKSGKEKIHLNDPEVGEVFARLSNGNASITKGFVHQKMQQAHKRESLLDMGLGGMTILSGLCAMAIKEKAVDPDEPPRRGLARLWQWVQERPLAIAGVGYMISTLCHAVSTELAYKYAGNKRRKTVNFRRAFVGLNVIAETLLAFSSKGHGDGVVSDNSVDNTVLSLAADMIVKQPMAKQNELIDHMALFLGRPDVLALKDTEVADVLRREVEAMRKNPWALPQINQPTPPVDISSPLPSLLARQPEEKLWQRKMEARDAAAPSLQTPA